MLDTRLPSDWPLSRASGPRSFPLPVGLRRLPRASGPAVLAVFRDTIARHGVPASVLSDNGMVFTARFAREDPDATPQRLQTELAHHKIAQNNTSPNTHKPSQSSLSAAALWRGQHGLDQARARDRE